MTQDRGPSRRSPVSPKTPGGTAVPLTVSRYKSGRHWEVREADSDTLVVVTVYRKGAVEVVRRLTGATPKFPARKRRKRIRYSVNGGAK